MGFKMWCIQAMGYYLAVKRNQLLIYVTAWINLDSIMLT
jgi:hypothetical protein